MTSFQKAAALAAIQVLFAGCSAGNPDMSKSASTGTSTGTGSGTATGTTPTPPPAPAPVTTTAPSITTQPAAASAALGATATFTVVASGSSLAYQWYKDNVLIAGATSDSYTTPAVTARDDGAVFTVSVFNSAGVLTSSAATLSVASSASPTPPAPPPVTPAPPAPTPPAPSPTPASSPSITAQPTDAHPITGAQATFSVTAAGSNLTYQWKKGGVAISGATSATYTTPAVTYQDEGSVYSVVVTNSLGTATSASAALHLALSTDQSLVESFELGTGGIFETEWRLAAAGHAQVSGVNYLENDFAVLPQSPLTNGPQFVTQSSTTSMTSKLIAIPGSPVRVLKAGAILFVPGDHNSFHVSYSGSSVQVDDLASDNTTVAYSQLRSGYHLGSLSGSLHTASTLLTNEYSAIFSNSDILDTTTQWGTGAGFLYYTASQNGDRYSVFDCGLPTTGAVPSACTTSATSLTAMLTAGFHSDSDGVTYKLADGAIVTAEGIQVWVATAARPEAAVGTSTTQYRIYFQLGNAFYTGALTKDKTVIGSLSYVDPATAKPVYPTYQIRLNKSAADSLAAGIQF